MASGANPVVAQPNSAAVPPLPPGHKQEKYTVSSAILKFFDDKVKDIVKGLGYTAFWAGKAVPNLPPAVQNFSGMAINYKNLTSATEIPGKAVKTWNSLKGLWTTATTKTETWANTNKAARTAFKDSTGLCNSFADSVDFLNHNELIPVDKSSMTVLKGVNFGATLGGAATSGYEQVKNFANTQSHETSKKWLYAINIIRDLAYATLGALGLFFVVTATAIVPWMMVACLTVGLTSTIGGYFCEKLYDPEGKGKNLDPEAIIHNRMLRHNGAQAPGAVRA